MRKVVMTALLMSGISSMSYALEAVLICRTSGIVYDTFNIASIDCGNIGSLECENRLKSALKSKYGQYDAYDAQVKACKQARGDLYPHKIKIVY